VVLAKSILVLWSYYWFVSIASSEFSIYSIWVVASALFFVLNSDPRSLPFI
jgi:hypothetical protein